MLSALAFCPLTQADTLPGILRVGTPGDYAPYSWYDTTTGSYRGSDIELVHALAVQLDRRVQFVSTTWATLVSDAQAGRFDIAVGGISITPERARVVSFSHAIASDRKQPVVRCGEQHRYDSQAEINQPQVRLIVNRGGTNERFSREQFPAATLTVHADNRSVFDEIRAGRADVMVTDAVEGRLQKRAGGLCVAKVKQEWAPAKKAVLIAPGSALAADLHAALDKLGGARSYQQGLAQWESYDWSGTSPATQLAALIDERLALVIDVARTKWNTQTAIEDSVREQALLQSLRERASAKGLSAAAVERFFGAQIHAAKILQRELFVRWQRQQQGQFSGVTDLATEIRPRIDAVTSRMLDVLPLVSGKDSRWNSASTLNLVSPAAVKAARIPFKELKQASTSR